MQPIRTNSLDHVALWVDDREPLAATLCDWLDIHVIEEGDDFTLLGADAREGKLTLFDAEEPRQPGVLERIFLRVADLGAARNRLPGDLTFTQNGDSIEFDAPGGLGLGLVQRPGIDYDLDHVVLRAADPAATAEALASLGFERATGDVVAVGDRHVELVSGDPGSGERPLLNHLALLVDSAEELKRQAEDRELEIEKVVDAENTLAVFVAGPAGITLEYVERKPSFSLT